MRIAHQEDDMRQNAMIEKMRAAGYVAASDAAKALGVTVFTLYRWAEARKVIGMKITGRWYFERQSLVDYVGADGAILLGLATADPPTRKQTANQ